jgi:catechol 2,3-dioxygenase-like lactoylglutathione lyase family enzyme
MSGTRTRNDAGANRYDRRAADLGNSVELGHVNVTVPDQLRATAFYVSGLGLTRDPYLMTGIDNMWVNVGAGSQFHLPSGNAQVVRGRTGLLLPDLGALLERLANARRWLEGTAFAFEEGEGYVDTTCPWGNRIRCHGPDPARFGRRTLGMPYVAFDVPVGAAPGIARFYREILGMPGAVAEEDGAPAARVAVAADQWLVFRETDAPPPPFDGHHIQITLADFSGPHARLLERGLVTEESNAHQYRFTDIVDLDTGKVLFAVEHEVRSMRHPMFNRPLVNRNPAINARNFVPGYEAWAPAMPPGG